MGLGIRHCEQFQTRIGIEQKQRTELPTPWGKLSLTVNGLPTNRPPGQYYSCRNATIGLTRSARQAGSRHANRAIAIIRRTTSAYVVALVGLTPKNRLER